MVNNGRKIRPGWHQVRLNKYAARRRAHTGRSLSEAIAVATDSTEDGDGVSNRRRGNDQRGDSPTSPQRRQPVAHDDERRLQRDDENEDAVGPAGHNTTTTPSSRFQPTTRTKYFGDDDGGSPASDG